MAIFASFVHCLPNVLLTWPHDSFQVIRLQWPWAYFKVIGLFHMKFLKNGVWYGKSYYRQLIGNHTLAFDWCHFWWPWSTFEGHFSLCCHFHVHFSYPWHAFASHGLPAIAELLVVNRCMLNRCWRRWHVLHPLHLQQNMHYARTLNHLTRLTRELIRRYSIISGCWSFTACQTRYGVCIHSEYLLNAL